MSWTFPLFRIFGIRVRMHWLMAVMMAVYIVQGSQDGTAGMVWMVGVMAILFVSILFHELAHCWMAIRLGGSADQIMIWPLGGLAFVSHSGSPTHEIKVSGIGPLSTFLLAGVALGILLLTGAPWQWVYLNPFEAWWFPNMSTAQSYLVAAARLNLILGLFNLCVPVYPLDGGKVLMAFFTLRYGRPRAAELIAIISIPVGLAMAVFGFAMREIFLGLIGVWVLYESFQIRKLARMGELHAHPMFGSGSEFEYMPERPRKKGWFARWRERRARARTVREIEEADRERQEVDAILEKVSRQGIGSLTPAERKILDRASRRGRGEER
jgi:Zn-dependent protease